MIFAMGMDKSDIADVLGEIAVLLEIKGENPFKIRAYQNGARALETLEEDLSLLVSENRLKNVNGIGDALAQKISELHTTGRLEFHEKLKASVAPGLVEMLQIPGLGAKKIKALHGELGIDSIEALKAACSDGRVASLKGFGAKTAEKIVLGIDNREAYGKRHLWWDAYAVAMPILDGLRALKEVVHASHAGSLRRGMETVGDLDFIVGSDSPKPIMDWFVAQPGVKEITAHGETKSSVRFESGLQADLRVVPPEQFAFALHHFTGSKDHNVAMRQRALSRGYSLSEWGLKPVEAPDFSHSKKATSEKELFALLDLNYIPPELREGLGEIDAAEVGEAPTLLEASDLKGVFHNHTTASDGRNTLEEMTAAAERLGWEYWGVADHSKASFQANGLDDERVLRQLEQVRALNASGKFRCHVFSGVECDILPDGSLDLEESTLMQLDCVVASVHIAMTQSEDEMTARLIRAIEHPATTMLGHLTGRILLRREGYKVNVGKIVDAAIANNVIIEINANPRRLDMDWRFWRRAVERGLLTSINPDAHRVEHFAFAQAGVNVARKAALSRDCVLNTRSLDEVKAILAKKRGAK